MAHIEIKIDKFTARIEDTDMRFRKILNGYMEDNVKPSPESKPESWEQLSLQEQLNLAINYIFEDVLSQAKSRHMSKKRRESEQSIIDSLKEFEPIKKASVRK